MASTPERGQEARIIYLSGAINQTALAHPRPDLGIMYQPGMGNNAAPLAFTPWGCDNGCYAQGDAFDVGEWLAWLGTMRRYRDRCLFAVAPDVVGDAEATLSRARPTLSAIRLLGFTPAFVTQDGCRSDLIPWSEIGALFVGGTNDWKLSEPSYALCDEAKARGLWTHMGRVNSLRRLVAVRVSLIDSADGTYIAFGPDRNLPRVYDWLDSLARQPVIFASQEVAS